MEYTFTTKFDKPLIRKALNHFFIKRLGRITIFLFFLVFCYILFIALSGSWTSIWTILSFLLGMSIGLLTWIYYIRLNQSMTFLSRMQEPVVHYTVSVDGIKTKSDLGTSEMKWCVFDEILKFPDLWLLIYGKSGYLTLRESEMPEAAKNLIEASLNKK